MGKAVDFIWATIQTALAMGITRGSFELCPGVGQIMAQQFLKRLFGEITMLVEGQGHSLTYWILSLSGGSGPSLVSAWDGVFKWAGQAVKWRILTLNDWGQTARALKVQGNSESRNLLWTPTLATENPGRTSQIPLHSTPAKPTQWNPDMTDALVLPVHSWNLLCLGTSPGEAV